ncbi:MAG: hypothetical protein U0232_19070 [Thermomicrobiales bacterium]
MDRIRKFDRLQTRAMEDRTISPAQRPPLAVDDISREFSRQSDLAALEYGDVQPLSSVSNPLIKLDLGADE